MQVFSSRESLGTISKTGNTILQLSSSIITLGAKQFTSGNLVCDLSTNGVGGLDTGALAINTLYYIYVVVSASNSVLIASISANGPTGFPIYKEVGKVVTEDTAILTDLINLDEDLVHYVQLRNSQDNFTDKIGVLRWGPFAGHTFPVINKGSRNIILNDDVGNSRTDFISKFKAEITINGTFAVGSSARGIGVRINDIDTTFGPPNSGVNVYTDIDKKLSIEANDRINIAVFNENTNDNGSTLRVAFIQSDISFHSIVKYKDII